MTEHKTLSAALAAFQAQLPKIGKDSTAQIRSEKGSYSYSYADLAEISSLALPLLAAQGLAWSTQPTFVEGTRFVLKYALTHSGSDQTIDGEYPLPEPRSSPQVLGSAITYARRYALCAVTGIAPGGDDDDAGAQERARQDRDAEIPPPADSPSAGVAALGKALGKLAIVNSLEALDNFERVGAGYLETGQWTEEQYVQFTEAAEKARNRLTPKTPTETPDTERSEENPL